MNNIDKQFLEGAFGTCPEVEDLEDAILLIQEWIVEIKELEVE